MKHKSIHFKLSAIALAVALLGCSTTSSPSALELQSFQRKEFDASKDIVFASVVSVLQDNGYIIKSADKDTGLISASSPTENTVFFGSHMKNTDVNAFVEFYGVNKTSVRLNFVKVKEFSSGYGMKGKDDTPVYDPEVYQKVFNKIGEAIFVRKKAYGQKASSNAPIPPSKSDEIYLYFNQNKSGPYSKKEVQDMLDSNKITQQDFYWAKGMDDWKTIDELNF